MTTIADRIREIRQAPSGKRVCAFFDYDGTLIEGFSAVAIARARVRSLEFGLGEALDFLLIGLRGVESEQDYAEVLRATKPTFAGKSYAELLDFGAIVNVLSALAWTTFPSVATYSTTKSAAWSLSNGLRNELAGQGTQVVSVHVGYMDTDMAAHVDAPKTSPDEVARLAYEGVEQGLPEVLADAISRGLKQGFASDTPPYAQVPAA